MHWKQPISTEILNSDMYDDIDRLMYLEICIHFRNDDGYCKPFLHGNKFFRVYLKRGEAIFNTKRFCRLVGINSKVGTQKLDFLKNTALKVELKREPYGFIVSLKNPEEFFFGNSKSNSKGTQRELKGNANNKSIKNIKNDKKEYIDTPTELENETALEPTQPKQTQLIQTEPKQPDTQSKLFRRFEGGEPQELRHTGKDGTILLTEAEYFWIARTYGKWGKNLLQSIEDWDANQSPSKKVKNHIATFRNWVKMAKRRGEFNLTENDFSRDDFETDEQYAEQINKITNSR